MSTGCVSPASISYPQAIGLERGWNFSKVIDTSVLNLVFLIQQVFVNSFFCWKGITFYILNLCICTTGGRCCSCAGSLPPPPAEEFDDPDVATESALVKQQKENGFKVLSTSFIYFSLWDTSHNQSYSRIWVLRAMEDFLTIILRIKSRVFRCWIVFFRVAGPKCCSACARTSEDVSRVA